MEGLIIPGSTGVLTRSEAEEEGYADHVGNSLPGRGRVVMVCKSKGMHDKGDWDWFDPARGWVQFGIGLELGG